MLKDLPVWYSSNALSGTHIKTTIPCFCVNAGYGVAVQNISSTCIYDGTLDL